MCKYRFMTQSAFNITNIRTGVNIMCAVKQVVTDKLTKYAHSPHKEYYSVMTISICVYTLWEV